jgi:hypothetical protein
MTTKERINSLFVKYNVNFKAEDVTVVEVKLSEVVLEDDTVFTSEDEVIVEGSQVTVINADGEKVSVPSGDYTDKDGRVLVVSDGIVMEIKEAVVVEEIVEEVVEEVVIEASHEENLKAAVAEVLEITVSALKAEFAELRAEFAEVKAEKETLTTELEVVKATFEAQGLPQVKVPVKETVKLKQEDIKSMTPKERVAHINKTYTKTK